MSKHTISITITTEKTVKRRFCFVQVDQTYEPWQNGLSLPPCGPYLATSNISPNNKVNTRYIGQCSEKELFSTSGRQRGQIYKEVYTSTSSCEWQQERPGGRSGPSVGSIAQLVIQKELFSGKMTGNVLFKQPRERDMDQGLCGERDRCRKKASLRRRDSDYARAEWYDYCWERGGDNRKAGNTV